MTTCPKCAYERSPADSAPDWQCPRCGVAYAKVRPSDLLELAAVEKYPVLKPSRWLHIRSWLEAHRRQIATHAGAAAIGILVGILVGREHLKYELRTAIQDSVRGIQAVFDGTATRPKERSAPKPARTSAATRLFKVALVDKAYRKMDLLAGHDSEVTFRLHFTNMTGKDIRAFGGTITFTDLLDNELMKGTVAINERIAKGATLEWEGKRSHNQFIGRDEEFKNTEAESMKLTFVPTKILFEDGTTQAF